MKKIFLCVGFIFFLLRIFPGMAGQLQGQTPYIVVSLKPIHSLVEALMMGRGIKPYFLEGNSVCPHTQNIRPKLLHHLEKAHLIIWMGPTFEPFLEKPLHLYASKQLALLSHAKTLDLIPLKVSSKMYDGHVWLDPLRVKGIVRLIAQSLKKVDPLGEALYEKNLNYLLRRLDALHEEMHKSLKKLPSKAFIVFHDAYGYLAQRYALSIKALPSKFLEAPLSGKALKNLKHHLKSPTTCVLVEPHTLHHALWTKLGIKISVVDILGVHFPEGPHLYFDIMENLILHLKKCKVP